MILLLPKLFYPQFIKFSASDVSIIAEVTPSNFRHLDENLMKRERETMSEVPRCFKAITVLQQCYTLNHYW